MSASKKSSKTIKSPAPATKTAVSKAPAKKKSSGTVTIKSDTTSPVLIQSSLPIVTPAVTVPAVVKAVASKPVATTISARVDVGFGNTLFVRGEGPGLSWEQGLAMENVGADLWRVTLAESARAFVFKFLINDTTWSTGPDFTVASGASATFTPSF